MSIYYNNYANYIYIYINLLCNAIAMSIYLYWYSSILQIKNWIMLIHVRIFCKQHLSKMFTILYYCPLVGHHCLLYLCVLHNEQVIFTPLFFDNLPNLAFFGSSLSFLHFVFGLLAFFLILGGLIVGYSIFGHSLIPVTSCIKVPQHLR